MQRLLALLCLSSALAFCACGDDNNPPAPPTQQAPGQELFALFVQDNGTGGDRIAVAPIGNGITRELLDLGSADVAEVWPRVINGLALYRQSAATGDGNWYAISTLGGTPRALTSAGGAILPGAWVSGSILVTHSVTAGNSTLTASPIAGDATNAVAFTGYENALIDNASIVQEGNAFAYNVTDGGTTHVDMAIAGLAVTDRRLTRQIASRSELIEVAAGVVLMRDYDENDNPLALAAAQIGLSTTAPYELIADPEGDFPNIIERVGRTLVIQNEFNDGTDDITTLTLVGLDGVLVEEVVNLTSQSLSHVATFAGDTLVFEVVTPDDAGEPGNQANAGYSSLLAGTGESLVAMTENANHQTLDASAPENELTFHALVDDFVIYSRTSEPGELWRAQIGEINSQREIAPDLADPLRFLDVAGFRLIAVADSTEGGDTFGDLYSVEILPNTQFVDRLSETALTNADAPISTIGFEGDSFIYVYQRGDRVVRVFPGVEDSERIVISSGNAPDILDMSHGALIYTMAGDENLFSANLESVSTHRLTDLSAGESIESFEASTETHIVFEVDAGATSALFSSTRFPGIPVPVKLSGSDTGDVEFALGY